MNLDALAEQVIQQAKACGVTIVTAESCTAGALAHTLSKAPGAGEQFAGGFVTYSKEMKVEVLGVPPELLGEKSAVCVEVAHSMAVGALDASPADVAVAVTGVAGPEPDEDGNPVGLVFIAAMRTSGRTAHKKLELGDVSRAEIMQKTLEESLTLLKQLCSQ